MFFPWKTTMLPCTKYTKSVTLSWRVHQHPSSQEPFWPVFTCKARLEHVQLLMLYITSGFCMVFKMVARFFEDYKPLTMPGMHVQEGTHCIKFNVGRRLVSWYSIGGLFPKKYSISWFFFVAGTLLGDIFFRKAHSPSSTFLWIKLVHLLEKLRWKPENARFPQKNRCLIKPILKNSTQTIFQGSTPCVTQILNNVIVWMVLYHAHKQFGWKRIKTLYPPFFE